MGEARIDANGLTVVNTPLIPRLTGDGSGGIRFYQEGDRVVAFDAVGGVVREGIIGVISSDGSKDYMCVTYGEAPFDEYFICTREDLRDDLPDPEDAEALEAWLESGA